MKTMTLTLATLLLSGCSFLKKGADEPLPFEYSPAGHRFILKRDNGGLAIGVFTMQDLGRWLDARIEEWVAERAAKYGGEKKLRGIARTQSYYLADHFELVRGKKRVAGQQSGTMVVACIYGYNFAKTKPTGTFRFLYQDDDGVWYWEVLTPGREIPVIGHELDHAIGIGHDDE